MFSRFLLLILISFAYQSVSADFSYAWPGLNYDSEYFSTEIKLRAQLRASSEEPPSFGLTDVDDVTDKSINRGRIKIGGHVGSPKLTYYTEYDFPSSRLLDLRFTYEPTDRFNIRVGQWKVPFNRERIDSSSKQQFADRSISNRWFTLDRQRGVVAFGRSLAGSALDSTWHIGVIEGTGRNGEGEAEDPLLLGRWDWNFLKEPLAFSQSDTDRQEKAAGVVSFVTASYRGPYTAFSSSGGGQLPGYVEGDDDRYDVLQYALESAWQYRGFSWQQEWHIKKIEDTVTGREQTIRGGYVQAGTFPVTYFEQVPEQLEFAVRYARVEPSDRLQVHQREWTLAVNWFFSGHDSKLTLDYTNGRGDLSRVRDLKYRVYRLQWDFHL
ncbi:MAG: hypothetical protein JJ934_06085 [Pseudomonadales bacterium]|nr:hypothetical protein [Pseudomonadales bacterium]